MVFACQRDSFLKEFASKVVSCAPGTIKTTNNGKPESIKGYEVVLEDTILFPEGGGQPCDFGHLNEVPVIQVSRRGSEAVHFVEKPIDVGVIVKQTLDWERRLDHMQQHSGQHLITALVDQMFGYATTAWWLGEDVTYIELDTPKMSKEQVEQLEKAVNEKIRLGISVNVQEFNADSPDLKEVRTKGLPEDHSGKVRVVTIEGIEADMCCGTHVSNLSHIQVIKLLYAEKGKKGKMNLNFLAGERVLKKLSTSLQREQAITGLLNNGPQNHVDLIEKLQKSVKVSSKNLQNILKEIATAEAKALKNTDPRPRFFSLHRKEAEPDFLQSFIREVGDTKTLLFLTIGDEKGQGHMVLYGEEKYVATAGNKVCSILEGKGNGKGNKFQAKVQNLGKRGEAEKMLRDSLNENEP